MTTRRVWSGLAMAIALGAITAGGVVISQGGDAPAGQANIWVDTNGGSCVDSASLVEYVDANACATFDNAWDAAEAGDLIRVKNGNYTGVQGVSGDKASTTKIIGESKAGVVIGGATSQCPVHAGTQGDFSAWCSEADNFWLENVTVDSGDGTSIGTGTLVWSGVDNATFVNVDFVGEFPVVRFAGGNGRWIGGQLGYDIPPSEKPQYTCTNGAWLPLTIYTETLIEGVLITGVNQLDTPTPNVGACGDDGVPHIEMVRFESSDASGTIFRNNVFAPSEIGSGHIFSSAAVSDVKLIGNVFGDSLDNEWILKMDNWDGLLLAYNTFPTDPPCTDPYGGATVSCGYELGSGAVKVGNIARDVVGGCTGTHIKNVWNGSGSCGTDTYVGATNMAVDVDGHIEAGSPAIDAGETPGASDYCTDAAYVNSIDFDGDVRPQGSVCDAGADERP